MRSNDVRGVIVGALDDLAAVSQAASRLEKEYRSLLAVAHDVQPKLSQEWKTGSRTSKERRGGI